MKAGLFGGTGQVRLLVKMPALHSSKLPAQSPKPSRARAATNQRAASATAAVLPSLLHATARRLSRAGGSGSVGPAFLLAQQCASRLYPPVIRIPWVESTSDKTARSRLAGQRRPFVITGSLSL